MTNLTQIETEKNLILNGTDIINLYWMNREYLNVDAIEITTESNAFSNIEYARDEAKFTEVADFGKLSIISSDCCGRVKFVEYDQVTADQVTAVKVIFSVLNVTTDSYGIIEYVINKDKVVKYIK